MEKPALGNRPTPRRSRQLHASTTLGPWKKAECSGQHGTQEHSPGTGVFTGFCFLSPLFLPPARHSPQCVPAPNLMATAILRFNYLLCWGLTRSFSSVITHSKNNLCRVSFVSDSTEGLSTPPRSPGAQSIITHDIICHLRKKKKKTPSKALALLWGPCN